MKYNTSIPRNTKPRTGATLTAMMQDSRGRFRHLCQRSGEKWSIIITHMRHLISL